MSSAVKLEYLNLTIIHQVLIEPLMTPCHFCGYHLELVKNRCNRSYDCWNKRCCWSTAAQPAQHSNTKRNQGHPFPAIFWHSVKTSISSIKRGNCGRKLFCASFSKRISESNRHSHETILYIRLRIFIQDLDPQWAKICKSVTIPKISVYFKLASKSLQIYKFLDFGDSAF